MSVFPLIRNELTKDATPKHSGVRLVLMIAISNLASLVLAVGPALRHRTLLCGGMYSKLATDCMSLWAVAN